MHEHDPTESTGASHSDLRRWMTRGAGAARSGQLVLVWGLVAVFLAGSFYAGAASPRGSSAALSPAPIEASPGPALSLMPAPEAGGPTPVIDGQAGTGLSRLCSSGSDCVDGPSCVTSDGLDSGQGQPWGSATCTLNLTTTASPDDIVLFFTAETNSVPAVAVTVGDSETLTWHERAAFSAITPADYPGTSYPTGCPATCTLGGYEYWAEDLNVPGVDEITIDFEGSIVSPPSAIAFGVSGVNVANPFDAGGPSISNVPESDYPGASPATGTITTVSENDLIVGLLGLGNTTSAIQTGGGGFDPIGAGPPAPAPVPSITLSPTAAANGNTVTVTGSGFSPADTSVSFSGLGSFTFSCAAAYGYVGIAGLTPPCTFVVPTLDIAATGGPLYTITAVGNVEGGSTDTATAAFDLTPPTLAISPGPTSGPAGTWVELTGAFFDESTGGVGSVTIEAPGLAPITCPVSDAAFAGCQFQIPSGATAPYVITAYGSDAASVPTDVATTTFDPTYAFSSETGTLSWGEYWAPAPAGGPYTVSASGQFEEWGLIVDAFAPSAPRLTISSAPLEGPVGTPVTVTGSGFASGETISSVEFGDTPVTCAGGAPTVAAGSFTCSFAVPATGAGVDSVTAFDPVDGSVLSTNTFLVTPQLAITGPTSGPTGTTTTLVGTGWTVGATVGESEFTDVPAGGLAVAYPPCLAAGSAPVVGATGGFSCTLTVPAVPPGLYAVFLGDTPDGVVEALNSFEVTAVSASISPASGPVDTEVTLTAAGLAPGTQYALYMDTVQTTPETPLTPDGCTDSGGLSGTLVTTDTNGAFVCTAPVPSQLAAGMAYYVDLFEAASGNFISSVTSPASGQFVVTGALTPAVSLSLSLSTISLLESTTATVTVVGPASGPVPTGAVTLSDGLDGPGDSCVISALQPGPITIGTLPYAVGSCVLTPSESGSLAVTASYGGDSNYGVGTANAPLTVTAAALTMTPTTGSQDETLDVSLGGFTPATSGMTVTFGSSGSQITVDSVSLAGPSSIVVQITIGHEAPEMPAEVAVTFSGGAKLDFGFFRVTALDVILSPSEGSQDETLNIGIFGFTPAPSAADMKLTFERNQVAVDTITISGLSSITAEITIADKALLMLTNVEIHESESGGIGTETTLILPDAFRVTALDVKMTPSRGSVDETLDAVISGFTPAPSAADMTVSFVGTTAITVDSVAITGLSSIAVEITIGYHAKVAYYELEIVESVSGGPGTATSLHIRNAFHVTRLDVSVSPPSASQGESLLLVVSGFTPAPSAADMTVSFSGTGITVDSVVIRGLSSIGVTISIASQANVQYYTLDIVESVSGGPGTATSLQIPHAFEVVR